MNESRRSFSLLAAGALAAAGLGPLLASRSGGPGPRSAGMPGTGTRAQHQARYFPNVVFRTQHGRRMRFYDDLIKGRKVLINFMYTECGGICPRSTANLVKVQEAFADRLGRDVNFISISLTPERDTPARLKAYAAEQGCRDGWYFLTGQMADVNRVRRKLGMYDTADITQHTGLLTFGNEPAGKWGATATLGTSDYIIWAVKNRIDGWQGAPRPRPS